MQLKSDLKEEVISAVPDAINYYNYNLSSIFYLIEEIWDKSESSNAWRNQLELNICYKLICI